jgi:hypothetical protein
MMLSHQREGMAVTAEEYLIAFDEWQTQYIGAAVDAGKDFAFCERRPNCGFKLDEDGAAWDHAFLEPGAPAPGSAWTVYRLHGVAAIPASAPVVANELSLARQHRAGVAQLVRAVFGAVKTPDLRLVS